MADDPIPAVTEAEATGDIAAIFADIRAVYRVGVVNLIWRHLATIPDALPWAWAAIRPVYVDGTIGRAADAFRATLRTPALTPVPAEVFGALGLSNHDLTGIRDVLAAYDYTNSMALISLTALTADAPAHPSWSGLTRPFQANGKEMVGSSPTMTVLPALTPLSAMPPPVAALVTRLNRFGSSDPAPILASMYRHLSHWPPYLGLAWAALAPLEASGALKQATADTAVQARTAASIVPMPADPPPPHAREAIAPFIGDVLPKMVAICGMLRAMTTAPDA